MVVKGSSFLYNWSCKQMGKCGWFWAVGASGSCQEPALRTHCTALFKIDVKLWRQRGKGASSWSAVSYMLSLFSFQELLSDPCRAWCL